MAVKRLQREFTDLATRPPMGVSVELVDEDSLLHWKVALTGPRNSLYKDGVFDLDIVFSADYPFKPPQVKFLTKIYHPNIDEEGTICVDLLKSDVWKPATKVVQVMEALSFLLEHPNPDDALVASIAEVYNADRPKYEKTVKEYVHKYAAPAVPPKTYVPLKMGHK